ncbi:oligosaccharide repeat unit polymerase [candidate division GN15 bacterium]|nr:oligosaccharide repeat unit polymerase [candidate division GN15 bacterium]
MRVVRKQSEQDRTGGKTYWWIRPYLMIFLFIIPVFVLIFLAGADSGTERNYFRFDYFLFGLMYLVILGVSAFVGARVTHDQPAPHRIALRAWFLDLLAIVTMLAYVIWFREIAADPQMFARIILGHITNLRGEVSTIPGITTFTQLGVVYVIFYGSYRWLWRKRLPRRFHWYLAVIITLTVFRTLAWSERLAALELLVPLLLIYLLAWRGRNRLVRGVLAAGPYAGLLGLIAFFGLGEFFRSWAASYQYKAESFLGFVVDRFYNYYFTSLNNGSGLLTEYPWPELKGQFVFGWLYAFPGIGHLLRRLAGVSDEPSAYLMLHADPEFNTFSGVYPIYYDFGIAGAVLTAVVLGVLLGYGYRRFRLRSGLGLLLYPVLFVALAETLRIFYLGTSRVFPIVAFLIIGYFLTHARAGRERGRHG